MSISRRLTIAFLAIGVGISLVSLVALSWLERSISFRDDFYTNALFRVESLKSHLNVAVQECLACMLGTEPEAVGFKAALARADADIASFASIARLNDEGESNERALFERITLTRDAVEALAGEIYDKHPAQAIAIGEKFNALEEMSDEFNSALDELLAIEMAEVREAQANAVHAIRDARIMLLAIAVVSIVGALVMGNLVARRFTRRIHEFEHAADLVSEGHLERVSASGPPEMVVLANAFNRMMAAVSKANEAPIRLAEQEERYRSLVENAPICIHEIDCDGHLASLNRAGLEMLGDPAPQDVLGAPYLDFVGAGDHDRIRDLFTRALAGEASVFEFATADPANPRTFWSSFIPIRSHDGTVSKLMGLSEDVTERRNVERRQQVMLNELDHRVKNNLAAVLSLAEQSIATSDSLEDFRHSFIGRLEAMARTHEALARSQWRDVAVPDVVRIAVGPYLDEGQSRVSLAGPPVQFAPGAAAPMGLALHELATNSAMHGALSSVDGRVDISWVALNDRISELSWIESNGPAIVEGVKAGLGLELVRGLIEFELGANLELDFGEMGFRCRILFSDKRHGRAEDSKARFVENT